MNGRITKLAEDNREIFAWTHAAGCSVVSEKQRGSRGEKEKVRKGTKERYLTKEEL